MQLNEKKTRNGNLERNDASIIDKKSQHKLSAHDLISVFEVALTQFLRSTYEVVYNLLS